MELSRTLWLILIIALVVIIGGGAVSIVLAGHGGSHPRVNTVTTETRP